MGKYLCIKKEEYMQQLTHVAKMSLEILAGTDNLVSNVINLL